MGKDTLWGVSHANVEKPKLWNLGPNYGADTVVTRQVFNSGVGFSEYEVLVIKRRDNGLYALPGGFLDFGESAEVAAARELEEEAGINLDFLEGHILYVGRVDDPRNSDDRWIETTSIHKHLPPHIELKLSAGDDAADALWLAATDENLNTLHASHGKFVRLALARLARN